MQPYTTNVLVDFKNNFSAYISYNIASAIERALAPSPRTILQVIEDINKPERHAEIVQVVGSVILQPDTNNTIREKGVDALFRIVEQADSIGAVLNTIDVLGKLALEQLAYRERVSDLLKQVISNPKYPLNVRRKALQALQNLGCQDVPQPRQTQREALSTWRMTIVVMSSLLFPVVLAVLWWAEQSRWWIGFGLAGLLLAIAIIDFIRFSNLWIVYFYKISGIICSKQSNYNLALANFTKAIELDPYQANYYIKRGDAYQEMGNYEQAIADYTKAGELGINLLFYHNQRNYAWSIAKYSKVIEVDPNDARSYKNRGNAYEHLEDYERAIADYTKAIELDPNDAWSYNNRGDTYRRQGKHGLAIADYTKAGDISRLQGSYVLAITNYSKVIHLDPNNTNAYNNRGDAYRRQHRYYDALADCTKAIEVNSDYAEAYYHRGIVYQELGDFDAAISDFERCLALSPHPDLRENAEKRLRELAEEQSLGNVR